MPLLLEQVPFEGPQFARIPFLKMEDWDLADYAKFQHLATNKYMWKVYYKEIGVIALETEEWVCGVKQSGFLNLLCMPHYQHHQH